MSDQIPESVWDGARHINLALAKWWKGEEGGGPTATEIICKYLWDRERPLVEEMERVAKFIHQGHGMHSMKSCGLCSPLLEKIALYRVPTPSEDSGGD